MARDRGVKGPFLLSALFIKCKYEFMPVFGFLFRKIDSQTPGCYGPENLLSWHMLRCRIPPGARPTLYFPSGDDCPCGHFACAGISGKSANQRACKTRGNYGQSGSIEN